MKRYNPSVGEGLYEDSDGEYVLYADVPQWISTADRLPEKGKIVVVYAESADPDMPFIVTSYWNGVAWALVTCWSDAITHWMPLPPPPHLEDEEY